jgi:outer membrane protein OmpA-like peptidoglycan-associated protein
MVASGPGGVVKSSTNVAVNPEVQSSIEASPTEIRYRRIGDKVIEQGSANVNWKATNANLVKIDPFGTVATDGTQTIKATPKQDGNGPVNEVQTYTLVAANDCGGTNTQTASVRVTGSIEPIPDVPLASVFFPTGYPTARDPAAGLVQSQQEALVRAAEGFTKYLEYDPEAKLTVVGHADKRDSTESNQSLSERRAYRVKGYLISVGVPANRIDTVAYGDTQNLDESAVTSLHNQNPNKRENEKTQDLVWAYNRRVDIELAPKGVHSAQFYPGNVPEADFLSNKNRPGEKEIVTLAGEKSKLPTDSAPKE